MTFLSPFELEVQKYNQKRDKYAQKFTEEELMEFEKDFKPNPIRDQVTGFYRAEEKVPTMERAQAYVESTGQSVHFIEADIANLGGLNSHFRNNHQLANKVYSDLANIFAEEINKIGTQQAVLIRHGGDEISSIVIGGNEEKITRAKNNIYNRIIKYTKDNNLCDIPHPKHLNDERFNGVGLHVGYAELKQGKNLLLVYDEAAESVNSSKNGEHNVTKEQNRTTETTRPLQGKQSFGAGDTSSATVARSGTANKDVSLAGEDLYSATKRAKEMILQVVAMLPDINLHVQRNIIASFSNISAANDSIGASNERMLNVDLNQHKQGLKFE